MLPRFILCATLLAGCGGETGIAGDTSTDRPVDVPGEPDAPAPSITFMISFVTDIPDYEYLYVQTCDYMGHQTWVSIVDADPMQWRCDICTCEECTECPVCGPALPTVERIGGGESHTWEWDGVTYPLSTCVEGPGGPEHQCEETGSLEPGTYLARFCFAISVLDAFEDGWIEDPICQDVVFTYPVPTVEHLVNSSG